MILITPHRGTPTFYCFPRVYCDLWNKQGNRSHYDVENDRLLNLKKILVENYQRKGE